jgi:hypothetical protein
MFNHWDDRTDHELSSKDEKSQSWHAERLFPRIINGSGRLDALKNNNVLLNMLLCLPEVFYTVASKLESIIQALVRCYYIAEANREINTAAFIGIHKLLWKEFSWAKRTPGAIQLHPLTKIHSLKRLRHHSAVGNTSPTPNPMKKAKAALIQ